MQIRLTVLAPRGGQAVGPASGTRACDVLVTAPAGTALAAVASGLASAAAGPESSGGVVLYAGAERLDLQRRTLGEPPLVDGAVLSLGQPGPQGPADADPSTQLHVVAGPDAGGVHLLHGGRVSIGRSADADVPLDDPDVSRLHCEVTVDDDGRVTVADLGSTNGTALDGRPVGARPVALPPGALLRLGESTLRLSPADRTAALPTAADGEGHLKVATAPGATAPATAPGAVAEAGKEAGHSAYVVGAHAPSTTGPTPAHGTVTPHVTSNTISTGHTVRESQQPAQPDGGHTRAADQSDAWGAPAGSGPGQGADPEAYGRTHEEPRKKGIGAWARRLKGDAPRGERGDQRGAGAPAPAPAPAPPPTAPDAPPAEPAPAAADSWPDPAAVLLTAVRPGARLWERGPDHPESLVLRLGTADRDDLVSVPVTVGLREAGSLGLAGPRRRLAGAAHWAVAQLAALHSPTDLEIVLISTDRARPLEERRAEWAWLGWLPHVRPAHGQDCRLLLAYDRDQAAARTAELVRRLDDGWLGPGWPSADLAALTDAAERYEGPHTLVVVDGDPGSAALRETTARLAGAGWSAGIHLLVLAEAPAASPLSPVAATYETACAASLAFRECGAVGLLSGEVATALRVLRTAGGLPAGHGTLAAVDAVSTAWAERFARALAPLRTEGAGPQAPGRAAVLPRSSRLLDELGLARATPASLMARWAAAGDVPGSPVVLGTDPRGPLAVDLAVECPHLLVEGPPGSGRTELLRSAAASLASAGRPDRLGLLLVDGAGGERGEGLAVCTDLPHVMDHLVANDPVRMRMFAQALGAELKRRVELLGGADFAEWHASGGAAGRVVGQRSPSAAEQGGPLTAAARSAGPAVRSARAAGRADHSSVAGPIAAGAQAPDPRAAARGDLESPPSGTLRLRPGGRTRPAGPPPLPRLVVLVDDFDALVAPALGSLGRPAAGSVVRALEAVARDGGRLGVHLIATSARPDRTADTELARSAGLRAVLDAPPASAGPDDPLPGRGRLGHPDGRVTPFQGGRVTGRIPRTATLRPTVVPLEWERMGDPPTRRPVRELGNGPTDLALLASALERAATSVNAIPLPPLSPVHP
ncbi:FHA domain-containing protein [Streptomyces sp. NPDC047315]|uniref:FHA domain-containing protein n=1 Tax=Streptomyces sp. NPDC047315 TaxID=3155142 RepID=UPI0033C437D1